MRQVNLPGVKAFHSRTSSSKPTARSRKLRFIIARKAASAPRSVHVLKRRLRICAADEGVVRAIESAARIGPEDGIAAGRTAPGERRRQNERQEAHAQALRQPARADPVPRIHDARNPTLNLVSYLGTVINRRKAARAARGAATAEGGNLVSDDSVCSIGATIWQLAGTRRSQCSEN